MVVDNFALAAMEKCGPLVPWRYQVRDPAEHEILIEVHYCGLCHSDIHMVKAEWFDCIYPMVPGHEFVGVVAKAGAKVTKHAVGDKVGVGCFVKSCKHCDQCSGDEEQFCKKGLQTYGWRDPDTNEITYGGYGKFVVLDAHFAVKIPDNIKFDEVAPLLCAGITTYSPIMNNNMGRGNLKIGILGIGGLGHMAIQFASRVNPTNEVIAISRSKAKEELAKKLGAKKMLTSNELKDYGRYFDYLINTMSTEIRLDNYLDLLKPQGSMILLGAAAGSLPITMTAEKLMNSEVSVQTSIIGGIAQTQEMIDYCAKEQILPMIEAFSCDRVNEAFVRVEQGKAYFRVVLNIKDYQPPADKNATA